ncbi:MAG: (d)CMP kinase [Granulosicoccus sp.]|nr:(d)CMP kinase [Granulosicoccus sp.]
MSSIPVITIDGPSGAGKGTVARQLASELGYHLLDSGAVYRAAALHALHCNADLDDERSVMNALASMHARFEPHPDGVQVWLGDKNVTPDLRLETTGNAASKVALMRRVRESVLDEQRSFRQAPGLVADGRDMGTIVFPDAQLKVFLSASREVRAKRRAKQLKDKGIEVIISDLLQEIGARDERDSSREHSPLVAAHDALIIDSSELSIGAVVEQILSALPREVTAG